MKQRKGARLTVRQIFVMAVCVFVIAGVWQRTRPISFGFPLNGQASWYSRFDPGVHRTTANQEIFDDQAMTCAIWGVAFGTRLKVTNRQNGQSVIVRVNDRGPHRRFVRQGRVIDLTRAAFDRIAPLKQGLIPVRIETWRDSWEGYEGRADPGI